MPDDSQAPSTGGPVLALRTLGCAALERASGDGSRVLLLGPGKTLGVLAYLACAAGRTASRDHLTDLLWSELDPDAARHSLRHALWLLRQHLGDDAITATDGGLTLAAPLDSDRDAFLAAVERQDLERAVELYRGDFLPSFAAPGAADFEQWADVERSRLRHQFLRAVEAVVRDWLSRGRLRKARQLAARVRDSDRRNEAAWRLVVECVLAADDLVAAELEIHQLEEQLAAEGRPPEPATSRTIARVRARSGQGAEDGGAGRPALVAELVGREREFGEILAAWDRARHGAGRHLRLAGAAGLGKTRLLADVHARLRSLGATAVHVRANAGEQRIPFALLSELALALSALPGSAALSPGTAGTLVALDPRLSSRWTAAPDRSAESDALRRRGAALEELVAAVADEQPVAVLVDDLHWADAESRQALAAVLPRLARHHALVVTAERPGSAAEVGAADTESLALEPLTSPETAALLASLGALPAEPWAASLPRDLHAAARGSPLLVLETLRLALEHDVLTRADGAWGCPDPAALGAELARGAALRRRIADLERHQAWLLLLLALAGAPMPAAQLAAATGREEPAVGDDLTMLEVRGLVARDRGEWQPGHDEIAALAVEGAGAGTLDAAHRALGRAFVSGAGDDANLLKRAGKHLAVADDEAGLKGAFERWARLARRRGDQRGLGTLAADFLGEAAGRAPVRLASSLPLAARAAFVRRRTVAAAAVVGTLAAVAGAWAVFKPAPPPPDAVLLAVSEVDRDSALVYEMPLRRERVAAGRALDVARAGTALPRLSRAAAASFQVGPFVAAPGGGRWAYSRIVADSGGSELFVADRDGAERRLTFSPKDDGNPDWSPDGRTIAFQSSRWTPSGRSNVTLLDLASGRVTRLTAGDSSDGAPKWSPDGTRLAFSRQPLLGEAGADGQPPGFDLCWVAAGGGRPHCFSPAWPALSLLAWYDAHQVLVTVRDTSGASSLVRVDLETREARWVSREMNGFFASSADGRWIACLCERRGVAGTAWYVFATDRPDLAARMRVPGDDRATRLQWLRSAPPSYLDRLRIAAVAPVPLGGVARLKARGYDPGGRELPVAVLAWRSADPSVLSVDSATGDVTPRRIGSAVVHASAGGWREDSVRVEVAAPSSATVMSEDWSRGLIDWVPFGDPLPVVTTGADGQLAFWNNGDGSYYSGAYSRQGFGGGSGLGVEAVIASPVNAYQDQIAIVTLLAWTDSGSVATWDHRGGSLPQAGAPNCGFQYPPADGPAAMLTVGVSGEGAGRVVALGPMLRRRPYRVRIQVFPDGRCGFAVDGRPLFVAPLPLVTAAPYHLVLQGKSVGTRMLVGRVEMWTGVRPGVDWSRAPRGR